jgi:hypothetical protein
VVHASDLPARTTSREPAPRTISKLEGACLIIFRWQAFKKSESWLDLLPSGKFIETNVELTCRLGIVGLFTSSARKDEPLASHGINIIKGLAKAGLSPYDILAWSQILPTACAMVPSQAEVVGSPLC